MLSASKRNGCDNAWASCTLHKSIALRAQQRYDATIICVCMLINQLGKHTRCYQLCMGWLCTHTHTFLSSLSITAQRHSLLLYRWHGAEVMTVSANKVITVDFRRLLSELAGSLIINMCVEYIRFWSAWFIARFECGIYPHLVMQQRHAPFAIACLIYRNLCKLYVSSAATPRVCLVYRLWETISPHFDVVLPPLPLRFGWLICMTQNCAVKTAFPVEMACLIVGHSGVVVATK